MLAAARNDVIEFVRFDGFRCKYPYWFRELIEDGYIYEEVGGYVYSSDEGEQVIFTGDVFLRNKFGLIMHMNAVRFSQEFYEVE